MQTIEVKQGNDGALLVFGRSLFGAVSKYKNPSDFTNWAKHRHKHADLTEGVDFFRYKERRSTDSAKNIQFDYTIEAALKISTLEKERGAEAVAFLKSLVSSKPVEEPVKTKDFTLTLPIAIPQSEATEELTPAQRLLKEAQALVEAENQRKSEPAQKMDVAALLERFDAMSERLASVEQRLGKTNEQVAPIAQFILTASAALKGLIPVGSEEPAAPVPDLEPTKRVKIVRLVLAYASAKMVTEQEVYKHIYAQLSTRYGFDAWTYGHDKKNPNYLEIIEENGQIDNLYQIAVECLTLQRV